MKRLQDLRWSKTYLLIALTLALGAIFKLSAFARETFIASRFGLSSVTDAYFSLQQLPLAVASFMFGPFCRAFTPAYADARARHNEVAWLPGLMLYGTLLGLLLTALSLAIAPVTLRLFTRTSSNEGWKTLMILSLCYWPIIQIGLFAGIATSQGRNLSSLTMTGFPYLLMTVTLGAIYSIGKLGNLSLPLSMTAGFAFAGLISGAAVMLREKPEICVSNLFRPWKCDGFTYFAWQLGASSAENVGYSANQMLILFFMAGAGTGAVSANNCASRIGLLGFSLLVQPLSQLMQARLCKTEGVAQRKTFHNYLLAVGASTMLLAAAICAFRYQAAAFIYMRGKFSGTALDEVAALLPAWLCYFVVLSLNVVVGQYLFRAGKGPLFTRNMLCGYAFSNVIRFATASSMGAPWIMWCSVLGDGSALTLNLWGAGLRLISPARPLPLPTGEEA